MMPISIVPRTDDVDVYLVLDDLRTQGRIWREMDEEMANAAAIIEWIADGHFDRPVRIVAFNLHEGWSKDVTEDIAQELLLASREGRVLGTAAREFVERVTGQAATIIV